jgi:hypothetical protein
MNNLAPGEYSLSDILSTLAETIRQRHSGLIRELRIERVPRGIVLHGVTVNFYGKQIALHEVRQRYPVRVVSDQIVVKADSSTDWFEQHELSQA